MPVSGVGLVVSGGGWWAERGGVGWGGVGWGWGRQAGGVLWTFDFMVTTWDCKLPLAGQVRYPTIFDQLAIYQRGASSKL